MSQAVYINNIYITEAEDIKILYIYNIRYIYITEAEDMKKRWQEYTEMYKKDFNDPINYDGVITHTHLEPDILECEVKWALGKHYYE